MTRWCVMAGPSWRRRLLTALAGAMCQAASVGEATDADFKPPGMSQPVEGFSDCQVAITPQSSGEEHVSVTLTIAPDGSIKKISLPESAPDWMVDMTACVLRKIRFSPGIRGGVAVESMTQLQIRFAVNRHGEAATTGVQAVGPLITPPRIIRHPGNSMDCYPVGGEVRGFVSRVVVMITILPDGTVSNLKLPVGSAPWVEGSARCVLNDISFLPGTRDGVPVQAEATLPIVFTAGRAPTGSPARKITAPVLKSEDAELEAAYRTCYPADLLNRGSVIYSFVITAGGQVSNPKVIKGSGDPRLDEVGTCVLKMLRFTPLLQGSQRLRSSVTWQLPVRPPR